MAISTDVLSKDKESDNTDDNADRGAADHIADEVYARQDPCQPDGSRQTQHDDAECGVDIEESHRDDERAHGMAGRKALSQRVLVDRGCVIIHLIGSLGVDDQPYHRDQNQRT